MNLKYVLLSCCCLLVFQTARSQTIVDLRETIAKTAPATVALVRKGQGGPSLPGFRSLERSLGDFGRPSGSGFGAMRPILNLTSRHTAGFFVAPDLILANRKSFAGSTTEIVTYDLEQLNGNVVSSDQVTGLVLIRVEFESSHIIAGRKRQPEVGMPVVVHYLRDGKTPASLTSIVGSYPDPSIEKLGYCFSVNISYQHGALGAPVVDDQGGLVGVVAGKVDGMMLCVPTANTDVRIHPIC